MPTQKKIDIVKNLEKKLEKAKAFFLADFKGLTHVQFEELRRRLKKTESEFVVVKNTLFARALDKSKIDKKILDELKKVLKESTAALFIYDDAILPIKTLYQYIKKAQLPKIKSGFFEEKVASVDDFNMLATLPSRKVLLNTLVSRLNAPIQGLHYALNWNLQGLVLTLNKIKEKK